ncbi:acetyltransferase [Beutenbergia cavernae DSM 12333]|uniref:Acetyltransferase n=1 Tax=Beutenbergia cavernae (strain ATCC BAA-8 / DSM 12333 / CCUG 43141 / JCM 11478 / NBRC 16432 / NCIMB 13614 / HKI 0122) TaxID=471853 RepID=C5C039_BEUC1|nr:hypothetical protein [Beutenbergia cavernae]ACQ79225.1 acetyltransferase [Beutenbergia cavernae DSM 12333]
MSLQITPASADDVPAMADLAERRRARYATYQPRFWNPAPDARERHEPFLASLVAADDGAIVRVARRGQEVAGFAVGTLVPPPPVYAPGGPACLVDDFAVADDGEWPTVGVDLLRAVTTEARARGAVQVVVVTAHLDEPRREALRAAGLTLGSEWWVGAL